MTDDFFENFDVAARTHIFGGLNPATEMLESRAPGNTVHWRDVTPEEEDQAELTIAEAQALAKIFDAEAFWFDGQFYAFTTENSLDQDADMRWVPLNAIAYQKAIEFDDGAEFEESNTLGKMLAGGLIGLGVALLLWTCGSAVWQSIQPTFQPTQQVPE